MKMTEEQQLNSRRELEMQWEMTYLSFIKSLYKFSDYVGMERVRRSYQFGKIGIKHMGRTDRLKPQGREKGIMFIGTNPGQASKLRDLWTDPYGIFLKPILNSAGIDEKEVWMTNLYKKKTLNNRPLNEIEIKEGISEIFIEIEFVDPTIIVTFGKQVSEVFKNYIQYPVKRLFHPSYIRRNPQLKVEYINKLKEVKEFHDNKNRILDR